MKKKSPVIILFICMLLDNVGLFFLVMNYTKELNNYQQNESKYFIPICAGIALLLVCWVSLLIILIKNVSKNSQGVVKDSVTGLKGPKFLAKKLKKMDFGYNQSIYCAYIAFDIDKASKKFDSSLLDKILKEIADMLLKDKTDDEYVGSVKRGAFAFLLYGSDGLHAEQKTIEMVNKMNRHLHQVLFELTTPFRAGLFMCDNKSIPFDAVLSNASIAYEFACDDSVTSCLFTEALLEKYQVKDTLQKKLQTSIRNGEFEPFLQFIYSPSQKKFTGAETLSRWNNPKSGFIMPAYYIHDMISCGVIKEFDIYMLDKVCALLQEFSKNDNMKDLEVSCNITRASISSKAFADEFKRVVKSYKFDRSKLIIEITEDSLVDNHRIAFNNMIECKNLGAKIALDDFGVGNTSFSDLADYPIDHIKVDREFIVKSTTPRGLETLRGLVEFAHKLNMCVVCEGVETKQQLDAVLGLGADLIQGYYHSYVFSIPEAKNFFMKSLNENIEKD